jgi:UDP-glucose:(heptosyl)LPS alpha-1,3-glucosyltransferase
MHGAPNRCATAGKGSARRIIFVRRQFAPFGGAELILTRTLAALAARGIKVSVLAHTWPTPETGIEFIHCDPPWAPRALRETAFASAACKRLRHERDALVQAHERVPCCDIFRAGDGVHAAYLEQRRRFENPWGRAVLKLSAFHNAILRLERRVFASARLQAVIVNSAMVADEIVRHFGFSRERIHLVPNGIDLARFRPDARAEHRTALRKRLATAPDKPVALLVGSGYARKGLAAAIEALARSRSGAELWVVGRDKRPERFAQLAERMGVGPSLKLLGPQPDPLPYYAAADVLILPSVYDPFPSTVLEALATGLPVVTSTGCGARDAARRLDPGLVGDASDVDGIATALNRAFALAADAATVAKARAIAADYSLDAMIDGMLAVYRHLAPDLEVRAP